MFEKDIPLKGIEPIDFFGVNNSKLDLMSTYFPKLKLVARGSIIKVCGAEEDIKDFSNKVDYLFTYYNNFNLLPDALIKEVMLGDFDANAHENLKNNNVLLFGNTGKPIMARTPNQQKLVDATAKNDLLFALGPAGTGKTYTAIALAVKALKNREVRKIILSRPAVEAGENLGFLPGDLKEKIDPYLQPLYDALKDMIPPKKLEEFLNDQVIQIAPLAFMRGRTLSNAFVILDEAQNTTENQLKMFLTRMGQNTKFIITGDITQIDLPKKQKSGMVQALKILKGVKGIGFIQFDKSDIVRHKLVKRIVEAYNKFTEEAE
ncbi:PhoH family protein [Prolixibacteraceae bacterium JC049]|nr:PhoH family protein [Prolixibacteraceae bacterium JC049]